MKDLQKELEEVKSEIYKLQKRQQDIENELLKSSLSFLEKFRIWFYNDSDGYHRWYIDSRTAPLLSNFFEEEQRYDNFRRGETVTLERLVGEEIIFVFEDEGAKECMDENLFNEILEKYTPMMQEAMDNNIKSFKYDW